ncbi:hypothetical protein P8A21_35720 [Streptomyces poriferorum]|uniref:hypothetical protein n=1 Tax=Streptomyces poriferorum TaxID=2798799 RepID=UPI00273E9106|nr:hypothetical protein [Streptomyces sp. Alt1]WLQ52515.1 hypothetical protein P8A21_35720 [Streptomyces sp. Alt1]
MGHGWAWGSCAKPWTSTPVRRIETLLDRLPCMALAVGIALRALFGAFPDLALAVPESELVPQSSFIAHGYQRLPVILRPAEVVAAAV